MLRSDSCFSTFGDNSPIDLKQCQKPVVIECERCKHRRPELEEFFYLLVTCLKLVHPAKDIVLTCKSKEIYEEAMQKESLQMYEYISFIQNYLDKYALRMKFSRKKKVKNLNREGSGVEAHPEINILRKYTFI